MSSALAQSIIEKQQHIENAIETAQFAVLNQKILAYQAMLANLSIHTWQHGLSVEEQAKILRGHQHLYHQMKVLKDDAAHWLHHHHLAQDAVHSYSDVNHLS